MRCKKIIHFYNLFLQLAVCPRRDCISTVGVRKDLFKRNPHQVPITDFFGSVRPVELLTSVPNETIPLKKVIIEDMPVKPKPQKYSYVPPLVNFASLK